MCKTFLKSFVKHKCFLFLTIKDLLYLSGIFYTVHFDHFKYEKNSFAFGQVAIVI